MRLTYEILKFLNKNMFEWGHIYFNKGNDMSAHIYVDSSSTRTELHPCSIEALGMTDEVSLKAFAVGSYELNETTGDRKGQITVFNESTKVIGQLELDSGVLDMKVIKCGRNNSICTLVSAESNGQLSIYSIQETSKKPSLTSTSSYLAISPITEALPLDGPFGLALSVDVCENTLVASYQDGAIATFALTESDLTPTGSLVHTHTMSSIDQPVWTVAFNKHACPDGNYFLSGGDDCCMKLWDLRIARSPVHVERRYDAGVTSAQWHPSEGNIFATGSYDENVRIWDDRMLAKPIHKIHTGLIF